MRRLVLGSLTAALVLTTGACAGDEAEPTSSPPTSTTATPSSSSDIAPSSTPAPTEPAETPEPTEPTVATATGVLIPGSIASINAPADFNDNPTLTSLGGNVSGPDFANVLLDDLAIDVPDESLDYMAKSSQEGGFIDPPLKRQPDIVVAGQPAYHLAGKDVAFNSWADEYGFRYQGHDITVVISTPLDMPQAERDALAAPVLASLTLQG